MNGSRTIHVVKRDGQLEPFGMLKLAGAMWRGMQQTGEGRFRQACDLAQAVEVHLHRTAQYTIASDAIFTMIIRVLRRVGMGRSGQSIETHRLWRRAKRVGLVLVHGPEKVTLWDKGWLCEVVRRAWNVSPATARTVAGAVEGELLAAAEIMVTRAEVLDRMNRVVSEFGLAEAVPVQDASPHA